jgi:hypothetical protein
MLLLIVAASSFMDDIQIAILGLISGGCISTVTVD